MVVALAGRRVDAPGEEIAQFPRENVARVRSRIFNWLAGQNVNTLVCSAACGADLLALGAAEELGIRRCIVLPFPREQFRAISVVDRGGDWGAQFDVILDIIETQGEVIVLGYTPENETAFIETNHVILELAISTGSKLGQPVKVGVVWDGASHGDDDVTNAFQKEAQARGLAVEEISTL
jgi:hypothetical protein